MGLAQSLVLSADTPYVARLFILDQFNMLMAMAMAALCVERLLVMMLGGVHAACNKMDDKEEVVGSSHEALDDIPDLISNAEIKSATPADGDSAHSAATTAR